MNFVGTELFLEIKVMVKNIYQANSISCYSLLDISPKNLIFAFGSHLT